MSLELVNLSVSPAGLRPLFAPLSLHIRSGEVVTVMGPSGIGKSTLLSAIGGLLDRGFTTEGQIRLNGRDMLALPAEARRIGLLFQDAVLFPHLSVGDNLAFGLARNIRTRKARRVVVEQTLEHAGLSGMYDRDPATLSGGQKARAALMRTLLAEPQALLLDEPFSKLDAELRAEIRQFTFAHVQARQIPALMVTHDPDDADATRGRIIDLSDAGHPTQSACRYAVTRGTFSLTSRIREEADVHDPGSTRDQA